MSKSRFQHLDERIPTVDPVSRPAQPIVARKEPRVSSREGKRAVTFYVKPETYKELHHIALDEGASIQALMGEALDLLARSRSKHPFGER